MVKKASSLSALGGLVYSTDGGRHCPDCQQPKDACICGTGGSLKDGVVEIQGEHVELLIDELLKRGFKAKKSGG